MHVSFSLFAFLNIYSEDRVSLTFCGVWRLEIGPNLGIGVSAARSEFFS